MNSKGIKELQKEKQPDLCEEKNIIRKTDNEWDFPTISQLGKGPRNPQLRSHADVAAIDSEPF